MLPEIDEKIENDWAESNQDDDGENGHFQCGASKKTTDRFQNLHCSLVRPGVSSQLQNLKCSLKPMIKIIELSRSLGCYLQWSRVRRSPFQFRNKNRQASEGAAWREAHA